MDNVDLENFEIFMKNDDVVSFIKELMVLAVEKRITDIRFEAWRIRLKIDRDYCFLPIELSDHFFRKLISTFFIYGNKQGVNPLKTNRGSFDYTIAEKIGVGKNAKIKQSIVKSCRITVIPARTAGLSATIRLRDQKFIPSLEDLYLPKHVIEILTKVILKKFRGIGVFLVTGPPNSGKSTLLLAILMEIHRISGGRIAIGTLEDPIEVVVPEFLQIALSKNITYAEAAQDILTHDLGVVLIGETRYPEVAQTVFTAASSGHLVFTTLHTMSALGSIRRLRDLGIEDGAMSDHLLGVISQRLVRMLCQHCKEVSGSEEELEWLRDLGYVDVAQTFRAKEGGCEKCNGRGYKGMLPVIEIYHADHAFSLAADEGKILLRDLEKLAQDQGMKTMMDHAKWYIKKGYISVHEARSTIRH